MLISEQLWWGAYELDARDVRRGTLLLLLVVDDLLELRGEAVVDLSVEGYLLTVLREDVARQEDIKRIVNASSQILDSLPVIFFVSVSLSLESQGLHAEVFLLEVEVVDRQLLRLCRRDQV